MENFKKLSIKELRQRVQSNAPEAGRDPYLGLSIRFLSVYVTKLFLFTSITPFWITALSVLLFLLGVLMFAWHIVWLYFIGIAIIYASIVLDGCNGEVARLKGYKPSIGAVYIEPISHDIQYALMFIPMAMGVGSLTVTYVAFFATISKLLLRFFIMRFDQIILSEKREIDTEGEAIIPFNPNVGPIHKLYRFLNRNFFSSVGFIIPLFVFSVFNRIDLFIWLFALVYGSFAIAHFSKQIIHVLRVDKPAIN